MLEEKKKKKSDNESDDESDEEESSEDGNCHYVEKIGVSFRGAHWHSLNLIRCTPLPL